MWMDSVYCKPEFALLDAASALFGYNPRLNSRVCPRSMKVVQLICNGQPLIFTLRHL